MAAQLTERIILQKTKVDTLDSVKNLNLWGSELEDVSILEQMPNVEVLSLSVNRIKDLRHFARCTKLTELYLRKNDIRDLHEVTKLKDLPGLKILWLCDNPCASNPYYRAFVIKTLKQLEKLDNIDVSPQERTSSSTVTDADVAAAAAAAQGAADGSGPRRGGRAGSGGRRSDGGEGGPASGPSSGRNRGERDADIPPAPGAGRPAVLGRRAPGSGGAGGPSGGGPSATQRNILGAIQALLNELTPQSLELLEEEIRHRLHQH
eukprot:Hpha_TRINITY_DN5661_c0_g1::TRINITY_DN5661_c0_g1_i1::g.50701::m.50701